jgi:hypothetical protein
LRHPALYAPLLALHRSPVDANATRSSRLVSLTGVQWSEGPSLLKDFHSTEGGLTVLPELSGLPSGLSPAEIKRRAETREGPFEKELAATASASKSYIVGSYPERDGERVYHTVVLAGPDGAILGRYRSTHPNAAHALWAATGEHIVVAQTPLGRIGLVSADELSVPELGALYGAMRADILAAPAGSPEGLKVEVDAKLFSVTDPLTGRADFFPYAAAKQSQLWIVSGGRRQGEHTAAAIYGPEPIVLTPTVTAAEGADAARYETTIPAPGSWINQSQLIAGQQAQWFVPLVLPEGNACLKQWRAGGVTPFPCL